MTPTPPPSTIRIDFETYSEAGFVWNPDTGKYEAPRGAKDKGLKTVGAAAYIEHPTFEVLAASYRIGDGPVRRWRPGPLPPTDLLAEIRSGTLISGWNSAGCEFKVWNKHLVPRHGWPVLPLEQVRDTMACSRAHALPGALGKAAEVLGTEQQKNTDGKRLLDKFSIPRNPTKADPRRRIRPEDDPVDAERLYGYCDQDVLTEDDLAARIPTLPPLELANWMLDRRINDRGVQIDVDGIECCIAIIEQAHDCYNAELQALTGGVVERASQVQRLIGWLGGRSSAHAGATSSP